MKAHLHSLPISFPLGIGLQLLAIAGLLDFALHLPFHWAELSHPTLFLDPTTWTFLSPVLYFASIAIAGWSLQNRRTFLTSSLVFMLFFCGEELLMVLARLSPTPFSPLGCLLVIIALTIGTILLANGLAAPPSKRAWGELIFGALLSILISTIV